MSRRAQGPRLYLDRRRGQWVVREGADFIRTGCAESDREGAEKRLAEYIASKYRPAPSPAPLIADVLLVYARDHLPDTRAAAKAAHNVSNLSKFWGTRKVSDISVESCKEYISQRPAVAARRDLEVLRAAVYYWNKHNGPLDRLPQFAFPEKPEARERWLTRDEAKRLRKAAMNTPHLYRFVVLGLKTGTRSGALFNLEWSWVDLERGIMRRRAPGEAESNKRTPPVRLSRSLTRLMRLWKRQDGKVKHVIHYNGLPVQKLRRSWAAACKEAGIEGASPHTLRHTRATWLMQAGIDPWEAAGHLGMSLKVLEKTYGKHSPDYQARAAEV